MYQIQLKFKGQNKKITLQRPVPPHELSKLIAQTFNLSERVIGVTDRTGKFYDLAKLFPELAATKEVYSLATVKDLKQESMSFGTSVPIQPPSTTSATQRTSSNRTKTSLNLRLISLPSTAQNAWESSVTWKCSKNSYSPKARSQ